jgi:hypothetical protein
MADPELLPSGRNTALAARSKRCEARPEFNATYPADVVYPDGRLNLVLAPSKIEVGVDFGSQL